MSKPVRHGGKWRIRWFDATGRRKSAVYDDYKRAQTELVRRLAETEDVRRGARDPEPGDRTCNELFDYWEQKRAPRKRSKKDDLSLIRKHLRPHFGHMLVKAVGTEDGDDYVNLKIDAEGLSDKYVHNHLTLLGTMLRAAASFKVPWILKVPRFNKPRVALFSTDYQWLRTDDEVAIFQEILHRVLTAANLPKVMRGGKERPYITFHGLRHSFASHWVMKGGDIFKLQRILGHASIAMTQRYAHLAPEAFVADYARLGEGVRLEDASVIELPAVSH